MDYAAALDYLDRHVNLEKTAAVAGRVEGLSLEPIRRLLHVLGDPHLQYPVIHVTGTNGKGSVARMCAELLAAHGLSVGLYTSPHLQRVNERLWWSGESLLGVDAEGEVSERVHAVAGGAISDDAFARVVSEVAELEVIAGVSPSYFEILTAAAFTWFAQLPVDVAVVEVGLLGRFDATNVVESTVAVITNVGHDHTDFAGDWRAAIATEKAGIVKPGSFLVLGETEAELRPIFEAAVDAISFSSEADLGDEGDAERSRMWVRDEDFGVEVNRVAVGGRLLDIRTPGGVLHELFVPVHGEHQGDNAAVALAAVEAFFARPIEEETAQAGFMRVRLPGRCEVAARQPLVLIDGAHNPDGAAALVETLNEDFEMRGRRIMVLGFLAGRDLDAMLDALEVRSADLVIACTAPSPRAVLAADVASAVRSLGVPVEVAADVADAIDRARAVADPDDAIIITASLYVAGAARTALGLTLP